MDKSNSKSNSPSALLAGRAWALWGPETQHALTDAVIRLVGRHVPLSVEALGEALTEMGRERYIVVKQLSVTGHAVVYVAVDRVLAREVAIKIHRKEQAQLGQELGQEYVRHRTLVEGRTMSAVEHVQVVRIFDMGEIDGGLYSVIELCECDLLDWSRGRPWPEIVARIVEAGVGLAHVHALGFAHGDIKPSNILIKHDTAKLADFGHASRQRGYLPMPGGTTGYIAPEVVEFGPGVAADVFALAVTTWVCLFGCLPHGELPEDRVVALNTGLRRACEGAIERPRKLPRGMPRRLIRALVRALAPHRADRPSLAHFVADLRSTLPKPKGEGRVAQASVAVILCAGSLAVGVMIGQGERPEGAAMVWTTSEGHDPLAQAKYAAEAGDGQLALAELNRVFPRAVEMPAQELERLIAAASEVAKALELTSPGDAGIAWRFVEILQIFHSQRPPD